VKLWLIAAALALATPAAAQAICGSHKEFLSRLAQSHDEAPIGMGLVNNGAVLEILASPKGTWTLIVTHPTTGRTCVVASGGKWEVIPRKPPGVPL
jgi:hypothetical protein